MKIMIIFILVLITTVAISLVITYLSWSGIKRVEQLQLSLATWSKRRKVVLGGLSTFAFFCLLFFGIVSPIYDDYGITDADRKIELPDENWIPNPKMSTFHAITIDASPEEVWKWAVQFGGGRAGAYSYYWAENLFGYNIYNTYELRDEWQSMDVGQLIIYTGHGDVGLVTDVDLNHYFVNRWDHELDNTNWPTVVYPSTGESVKLRPVVMMPEFFGNPKFKITWVFYLHELPDGKTRLLSRAHCTWDSNPLMNLIIAANVPIMHDMMDLEMLHQLKECAEGRASTYKNTELPKGGSRARRPIEGSTNKVEIPEEYLKTIIPLKNNSK